MTRELRFVCAQPATKYYSWQIEIMINNFIAMGVNPNMIDIVCCKENGVIPDNWSKLASIYPARFFFYNDIRETKYYISSIRPNILKQHWEKYPELKDNAIFYHDCDIIFSKPISEWITEEMLSNEVWYGSDTRWYIAHSYIKSKGNDVIKKMCDIMEVPEKLIEDNELNNIGAQCLMKNVDYDYWNRVEYDCERLYKEVSELNNEKVALDKHTTTFTISPSITDNCFPSTRTPYHPLQIWCADMWALLWGAWRLGYITNCHKNFEFSWGTSSEADFNKMNIMHNAGVTSPDGGLFYKAMYMSETPYKKELVIKDGTASKKYYEWIQQVEQKSILV